MNLHETLSVENVITKTLFEFFESIFSVFKPETSGYARKTGSHSIIFKGEWKKDN